MTKTTASAPWLRALLPGLLSGALAGTLFLAMIAVAAHSTPAPLLKAIAAVALGAVHVEPKTGVAIGALLHYGVSIAWATGYAILALRTPALIQAPLLSGLAYGIVVELTMDGLLVMVGAFHLPNPSQFLRDLIAHTVGFGMPLAVCVARLLPHATAAGASEPR